MRDTLRSRFPPFPSEQNLRSAVNSLCVRFGTIKFLRILPPSRGPDHRLRCTCFLSLDSDEAQERVGKELDGFNFGDTFAFFADVDEKCTDPTMWSREESLTVPSAQPAGGTEA